MTRQNSLNTIFFLNNIHHILPLFQKMTSLLNLDISKTENPDPVIKNFLESPDTPKDGQKCFLTLRKPVYLQIVKIYNISQPKISQKSHGTRLLRIIFQEAGGAKISGIEFEHLGSKLSIDTPSGTKVELRGSMLYLNNYRVVFF